MKRPAAVLLALALSGSLAACGDDPEDTAGVSVTAGATASPTGSATSPAPADPTSQPEPSAAPSAGAGEEPDEQEPAPVPFPADTEVDVQEPSGGPLSVVDVRVGRHEGYERVVFELDGQVAGEPGWRVEYVDEPTQQGSGNPVQVEGQAVLALSITGTGYPFDTGVEEVSGDPALPAGLAVVRDVVLGGVYEGHYEAFVGTAQRAPFRVFRLADPARVVLDVRTG